MLQKARVNVKTDQGYDTLYPETSSDQVIDLPTGKNLSLVVEEFKAHSVDDVMHGRFTNSTGIKQQVVLGWNEELNCPTMDIAEVVE